MKEKELKRLEAIEDRIMKLESELSVVYKRISEPLILDASDIVLKRSSRNGVSIFTKLTNP